MLIAGMEFPMLNRQLATSGSDTQGVRIIKLFFFFITDNDAE
jgi:hypothetical protein